MPVRRFRLDAFHAEVNLPELRQQGKPRSLENYRKPPEKNSQLCQALLAVAKQDWVQRGGGELPRKRPFSASRQAAAGPGAAAWTALAKTDAGGSRPGSARPGSSCPGSSRPGSARPGSARPGSAGHICPSRPPGVQPPVLAHMRPRPARPTTPQRSSVAVVAAARWAGKDADAAHTSQALRHHCEAASRVALASACKRRKLTIKVKRRLAKGELAPAVCYERALMFTHDFDAGYGVTHHELLARLQAVTGASSATPTPMPPRPYTAYCSASVPTMQMLATVSPESDEEDHEENLSNIFASLGVYKTASSEDNRPLTPQEEKEEESPRGSDAASREESEASLGECVLTFEPQAHYALSPGGEQAPASPGGAAEDDDVPPTIQRSNRSSRRGSASVVVFTEAPRYTIAEEESDTEYIDVDLGAESVEEQEEEEDSPFVSGPGSPEAANAAASPYRPAAIDVASPQSALLLRHLYSPGSPSSPLASPVAPHGARLGEGLAVGAGNWQHAGVRPLGPLLEEASPMVRTSSTPRPALPGSGGAALSSPKAAVTLSPRSTSGADVTGCSGVAHKFYMPQQRGKLFTRNNALRRPCSAGPGHKGRWRPDPASTKGSGRFGIEAVEPVPGLKRRNSLRGGVLNKELLLGMERTSSTGGHRASICSMGSVEGHALSRQVSGESSCPPFERRVSDMSEAKSEKTKEAHSEAAAAAERLQQQLEAAVAQIETQGVDDFSRVRHRRPSGQGSHLSRVPTMDYQQKQAALYTSRRQSTADLCKFHTSDTTGSLSRQSSAEHSLHPRRLSVPGSSSENLV
eukprot:TRINITY_DN12602_c0_g1_i1.p1 TRINITY_DN12602_c0_g1~~TRINITY_DN12602_c0_g1_i1.p1  ORF type:complete len:807 (-),score=141.30 TRINITY_DN12602_c0_g1_i1:223-2643(-)